MTRFQNVAFYTSVNDVRHLPIHAGVEVAFAGRSNAGKSSAINALAQRNRLAFVSKTPGRTQLINFFKLDDERYLVDLPGYGYAKTPPAIRLHWEQLLGQYLQKRSALHGLVLIMDIRHPLKPLDLQMLNWFRPTGKAIHILLTKSDKLSKQRANITLKEVACFLKNNYPNCSVQLFSSLNATGIAEACEVIENWLDLKKPPVKGE